MKVSRPQRGRGKAYKQVKFAKEGSRAAVRHFMFRMAEDFRSEADRAISDDPKTGRKRPAHVRRRYPRSSRRASSAKDSAHANLSHKARKSLGWKVHGTKSFDVGYGAAPDRKNPMPPWAPFLEEGTSRMGARLSIGNAIQKQQGNADRHWKWALDKELGR